LRRCILLSEQNYHNDRLLCDAQLKILCELKNIQKLISPFLSIKLSLIHLPLFLPLFCGIIELIWLYRYGRVAGELAHLEIILIDQLSEIFVIVRDAVCQRGEIERLKKFGMLDKQLYFLRKFRIVPSVVAGDEWLGDMRSWDCLVFADHSLDEVEITFQRVFIIDVDMSEDHE